MTRNEAIEKVAAMSYFVNDKKRKFDERMKTQKEMMDLVRQFNITYGEVIDYKGGIK